MFSTWHLSRCITTTKFSSFASYKSLPWLLLVLCCVSALSNLYNYKQKSISSRLNQALCALTVSSHQSPGISLLKIGKAKPKIILQNKITSPLSMNSDPYFPILIKSLQRELSFGIKTNVLANESPYSQQQEEEEQRLFQNCGMLVSIWYQQEQQVSVNYATAFSVSKNVIMTATSNIYQHRRNEFAGRVFYYPNVDFSLQYCTERYERVGKYYHVYEEQAIANSILWTNKNNIAFIYLEDGLKNTSFLKIGKLPNQYEKIVKIMGYACHDYPKKFVQKRMEARRGEVECKILENDGYVLEHSYCAHQMGKFSGSPILARNYRGESYVIGMKINSPKKAIYFNDDIINTIQQMEKDLLQPLSIPLGIKIQRNKQQEQPQLKEQVEQNMFIGYQAKIQSESAGSNMSDMQDLYDLLEENPINTESIQDQKSLDKVLVQQ